MFRKKNHIERFGNQTKHSMGELDGDDDSILKALSSKTVAKDFPCRMQAGKAFPKPGVVKKISIYDPPTFPCWNKEFISP